MRYKDISSGIFKLLGVAGIIAFFLVKLIHLICFKSVGALYKSDFISGRITGKIFYFLLFALVIGGITAVVMLT